MRWISIDPGFTRLGYALWEDSDLIESGVQGPGERKNKEYWIDWMDRGIRLFVEWIGDIEPSFVLFEQLPPVSASGGFSASPQVPLVFSAISAIKSTLIANEVNWDHVHSAHWKKVVFEDIKVTKSVIRRKIVEKYPSIKENRKLGDIPFDQTDAIAIGLAWIYEKNSRNTKAQSLKRSLSEL